MLLFLGLQCLSNILLRFPYFFTLLNTSNNQLSKITAYFHGQIHKFIYAYIHACTKTIKQLIKTITLYFSF